jgi:transposase-like protein
LISVLARRRRWTPEQKLALVDEVSRPDTSVAAVAHQDPTQATRWGLVSSTSRF